MMLNQSQVCIGDDPLQEEYEPIEVDGAMVTPTKVMQALEPRLGKGYVGQLKILKAVRLWRQREPNLALELLKSIEADANSGAALIGLARHMMIDISQMHDKYTEIYLNAQAILKENPQDVHARFVMGLYHACAHHIRKSTGTSPDALSIFKTGTSDDVQSEEWWKALNKASPFFSKVLNSVRRTATGAWVRSDPVGNIPLADAIHRCWPGNLVIGVFGWGPVVKNQAGHYEGLPPMMERIDAAFRLARAFPQAQIIASGGAVSSDKCEGDYIQETLVKRDRSLEDRIIVDRQARDSQGNALFIAKWMKDHAQDGTLLIVGSDWQNPRFKAIMDGTLSSMHVRATTQPVGAGSAYLDGKNVNDRILVEQTAIWRDAARALGYFEFGDFKEPVSVSPFNPEEPYSIAELSTDETGGSSGDSDSEASSFELEVKA